MEEWGGEEGKKGANLFRDIRSSLHGLVCFERGFQCPYRSEVLYQIFRVGSVNEGVEGVKLTPQLSVSASSHLCPSPSHRRRAKNN